MHLKFLIPCLEFVKLQEKKLSLEITFLSLKEELEESPRLSKENLMTWAKENDVPVGAVMQSFRLALVGKLTGPDLFQICNLLGKELSLKRIETLIQFINLKLT